MKCVSQSGSLQFTLNHTTVFYSIFEGHCLRNSPRVKPQDPIFLHQFCPLTYLWIYKSFPTLFWCGSTPSNLTQLSREYRVIQI